jgi:hypothetical protein
VHIELIAGKWRPVCPDRTSFTRILIFPLLLFSKIDTDQVDNASKKLSTTRCNKTKHANLGVADGPGGTTNTTKTSLSLD